MRILERSTWLTLLASFLMGFAAPAPAFQDDDEKDAKSEKAKADEDDDEDKDEWSAVVGGDVHTGTGSILRGATVLAKNGVIDEIGFDLHIPEDAEVLNAAGYRVYPGLVAVSSFGLFGGGSDLENTVDPYSQNMILALAAGITTAVNGNEVAKLKRGEIEGVVMDKSAFTSLRFNKTNPAGKRDLRAKFAGAAKYLRTFRQYEIDKKTDKKLKEPSKKGVDSTALAVLRHEVIPTFAANDRTDLVDIARLAQQYGFRPIIRGCREGWTVASELGRAGAFAIVNPRDRRPKDEVFARDGGSSIENAAILHDAGVQVVVIPGSAGISLGGIVGRDLMHLTIEAGFAIRGGLPEQAALASITTVPARVLGVDHRVGTLEAGKDADMIVTDGDLLHYQTFVQWALVGGDLVYDKEEELYFAHIRPRPESALAPETKVDAGEGEDEVEEVEEVEVEKGEPDDDGNSEG